MKRLLVGVIVSILAIPVLYVLSIGPAQWFFSEPESRPLYMKIYGDFQTNVKGTSFDWIISSYADWWFRVRRDWYLRRIQSGKD